MANNATTNQPVIYPNHGHQPVGQAFGHPHSPFVYPTNRFGHPYSPTVILPSNLLSNPNGTFPNGQHSNLTPKLPLTPFSLNGFAEEPRQSPFPSKESMANPFTEVFKQAAMNRLSGFEAYEVSDRNNHDDKTESLNTPSIDLKSFETRKYTNYSKLELLISADNFSNMCDNLNSQNAAEHTDGGLLAMTGHPIEPIGAEKTGNEPQNLKVDISSRMDTPLLDTPSTSSTNPSDTSTVATGSSKPKSRNKLILPKPNQTSVNQTQAEVPQSQPNYSYVLKVRTVFKR